MPSAVNLPKDPEWEFMLDHLASQLLEANKRWHESGDERWRKAADAFAKVQQELAPLRAGDRVVEMEVERGLI